MSYVMSAWLQYQCGELPGKNKHCFLCQSAMINCENATSVEKNASRSVVMLDSERLGKSITVLSLNYYFSTAVFTVADILPQVMLNSNSIFIIIMHAALTSYHSRWFVTLQDGLK